MDHIPRRESPEVMSHLFSTEHYMASTIRVIINLEAAGTTSTNLSSKLLQNR
ncbi:hypothetical protein BDN72DRAFT_907227 [Pluteus cervinus]|uniref:Uncharacterized protein n=1 Tax=Pluteus cervinus TaxID=181527 RepID=A0ACD2ZY41_9AGAR|nr:hypothetical protein BDN72DRAFT_907227 [Pluteus cervinus]